MFTFIETPLFTKLVTEYLSDEEYTEFQAYLVENPEAGAVVRAPVGFGKFAGRLKGVANVED
jgi:hypothetical protein